MTQEDLAKDIISQQAKLHSDRMTWESHWQEIAERVLPRHSTAFNSGISTKKLTRGEKRTERMYDATAALALDRFAAAMESMLTPRMQRWHRLRATDPRLNRNPEVIRWFDEVTRILFQYRYAPRANYASQQHEIYTSLGAFGTGVLFVDKLMRSDRDPLGGLRYRADHLSEVVFTTNHQGIPDTVYRKYCLTLRQAIQRFGDAIPESLRKMMDKDPNKDLTFIHCVAPSSEIDPGRGDFRGMAFSSHFVLEDEGIVVSRGGYNTMPYIISRYTTAPGEMYGRSPAMLALPSIKVLNEQKKTMLKQGHRVVDPVLLTHDDGMLDTFSLKPGAINAGGVDSQGRLMVQALPTGNLAAGQELMDMERGVINEMFLVTLFQILIETPRMTATEVLERAREKGALISPTMGRQQSEALGPMIERELDILARDGLLPEMPRPLRDAGGEFEVEYDSPLNRAARAEEASGLLRTLETGMAYAQATGDPSALDWIDIDQAMPALAEINAMPASWVRLPQAVAQMREARQQQMAAQQMIEAGPAAAAVMKTATEAGRG